MTYRERRGQLELTRSTRTGIKKVEQSVGEQCGEVLTSCWGQLRSVW